VVPAGREVGLGLDAALELVATVAALGGIAIAWALYLRYPAARAALARAPGAASLARFWSSGWGFDAIYDRLFVRPYRWFAGADQRDLLDEPFRGIVLAARGLHHALSRSENGKLRWYAISLAGGTAIIVALVLFS
jgi:NADH-quinone oxidoreductase subunit L